MSKDETYFQFSNFKIFNSENNEVLETYEVMICVYNKDKFFHGIFYLNVFT